MLHSPSSFEVSKPSLAGISRCVQENSSTPGELRSHSNYLISCCYRSAPMRQRFTLLLTGSMRRRRWCRTWLVSFCSSVSFWPRGFLVGMRISTWGSVNARKPRSCNNRLPADKGEGVTSAIRLSWTRPPQVSLRKRMVSRALISRTLLTVWSFFLPLSHAVCAGGSWGRTMRRSVPSWAQGGTPARRRALRPGASAPPPRV
jgi:hypothetical protein